MSVLVLEQVLFVILRLILLILLIENDSIQLHTTYGAKNSAGFGTLLFQLSVIFIV